MSRSNDTEETNDTRGYFTNSSLRTIINSRVDSTDNCDAGKWYFDTGGNKHTVGTKQYFIEYHKT
jgi:hypothetical protein